MKKKFKLLLILPHGPIHRYKEGTYKKALRYAPLTLPLLASLIPDDLDVEVKLVDEGAIKLDTSINADLVGISVMTGNAKRAYNMAQFFKKKGATVILGGVHVSLMPEEAKKYADSIFIGLAEKDFATILRDYANKNLKKVYYQSKDYNFRDIPLVKRELFDKKKYVTTNTIETTKGCINKCEFCAIAKANNFCMYFRPVDEVINEIKTFKSKEVLFLDPSPMENIEYSKKFLKEFSKLDKFWVGCSTLKIFEDKELLKLLKKSRCKGLLIGFESINQEVLNSMNKRFNPSKKYKEYIRILHDLGIAVQGCFVFGFDHDTKDVFKRTVDFVYESNIDLPQFSIYTPFPGTEAFNKLEREKRIIERDWSLYDAEHVVFKPLNMTKKELFNGLKYAWEKSYSLKSITKRLLMSKCLLPFSIPANLGYRFYAKNFKKYSNNFMIKSSNIELLKDQFDN
jgi:radical SAM superfamily enzyme YgiQ (UPF0313 family)